MLRFNSFDICVGPSLFFAPISRRISRLCGSMSACLMRFCFSATALA